MRVVAAADWRDGIAFETPFILAEVLPGEPTRCFACGTGAEALPRTELWAYKHRHPKNHDGFVRFYCVDHVPAAVRAPAPEPVAPRRRQASRRSPAVAAPVVPEKPAVLCPDCFVEVPATGVCGICGARVA